MVPCKRTQQVATLLGPTMLGPFALALIYMKKFNLTIDHLPEVRVHVAFVECLEVLWKT